MYRNFVAQHGYDVFDIGTTKGTILQVMYRIFDAQHVYKFLRNLETRMYRAFGTQHGYDVFKKNVCIDFRLF